MGEQQHESPGSADLGELVSEHLPSMRRLKHVFPTLPGIDPQLSGLCSSAKRLLGRYLTIAATIPQGLTQVRRVVAYVKQQSARDAHGCFCRAGDPACELPSGKSR
jgi:hypothetical protein